jgi:hypothetical protein
LLDARLSRKLIQYIRRLARMKTTGITRNTTAETLATRNMRSSAKPIPNIKTTPSGIEDTYYAFLGPSLLLHI